MNVKISGEQSKRAMLTKHVHGYITSLTPSSFYHWQHGKNSQRSQKKLSAHPAYLKVALYDIFTPPPKKN